MGAHCARDASDACTISCAQVSAALKRARRRNIPDKATAILAALRGEHLGQPEVLTAAYAATVRALRSGRVVAGGQRGQEDGGQGGRAHHQCSHCKVK